MPVFKSLPAEVARRLIEGIPDELTPLAEKRNASIKRPCPRCGCSMQPFLYAPVAFTSEDPLPKTLARCPDCEFTMDPASGIVLKMGNPAKVEDDPMLIT